MKLKVIDGCTCPVCGSVEVLAGGLVRPFKVHDGYHGWWSECLSCKETYGNGWFVYSEADNCYVLEEAFGRAYAATGGEVEFVEKV